MLYRTGRGVNKDYSAAFTWFSKAAAQAHAQAQYNLGVLYLNGWGTAADPDQARHWLELAASQGVAIASTKLKELHAAPSAAPTDADALWSAVRRGDVTQLDALLAHGAAANTRNAGGRTLLMEAADLDQTATGKRLIAAGADVNARDQLGATALMLAARNGNVSLVDALIAQHADVNATDRDGRSALGFFSPSEKSDGGVAPPCRPPARVRRRQIPLIRKPLRNVLTRYRHTAPGQPYHDWPALQRRGLAWPDGCGARAAHRRRAIDARDPEGHTALMRAAGERSHGAWFRCCSMRMPMRDQLPMMAHGADARRSRRSERRVIRTAQTRRRCECPAAQWMMASH